MAQVITTTTIGCCLLATVAMLLAALQPSDAAKVCPQAVANDLMPPFCATNAYGSVNVTRSAFENWNCNHPFNKYTQNSLTACPPPAAAITCTPANCTQVGPVVCARLRSPSPQWPNAFTSAVFGNLCQLTLYNCQNPAQQYQATNIIDMNQCTSVGL